MFCAGYTDGTPRDTCQGDSGGPLFVHCSEDDSIVLVGIASWGYGCAASVTPGIYTKVKAYADWVTSVTDVENVGTNIELGVELAVSQCRYSFAFFVSYMSELAGVV